MIKLCLYEHPVTGELFINFWWLCFMSCFETNNEWVETCTERDREKRGWDRERWKKDRGGGTYSGSGCSTGGSWGGHFWSGRLSLWSCRLTVPYTLHTEERKVWIILNDLWIICYRHTLKNKVLVILDFFLTLWNKINNLFISECFLLCLWHKLIGSYRGWNSLKIWQPYLMFNFFL